MTDDDRFLSALTALGPLAKRFHDGELTPAEYAACYVLTWQIARHGSRVAMRRSRLDPKPNAAAWLAQIDAAPRSERTARLVDLLDRYDLRLLSRRVNLALIGWLHGQWDIRLCETVPSVRTVLHLQALGMRPVTLIADYPRLLQPVLDKPDAFAFACHDLEHAWQFFHDPASRADQQRFAQRLECALEQGLFASYVIDPVFAEKLDYLAADMNTHVMHSAQYLRAILLEYHLRAEGKGPREQLSPASRASVERCLASLDLRLEAAPSASLVL